MPGSLRPPRTCFKHVSLVDSFIWPDAIVVHSVQLKIYLICPIEFLRTTLKSCCSCWWFIHPIGWISLNSNKVFELSIGTRLAVCCCLTAVFLRAELVYATTYWNDSRSRRWSSTNAVTFNTIYFPTLYVSLRFIRPRCFGPFINFAASVVGQFCRPKCWLFLYLTNELHRSVAVLLL
jgi:hypothetical protein